MNISLEDFWVVWRWGARPASLGRGPGLLGRARPPLLVGFVVLVLVRIPDWGSRVGGVVGGWRGFWREKSWRMETRM